MSDQLEVRSPFDGHLVGSIAVSTASDVETALASAHALFKDRSKRLSKPVRMKILARAAELIRQRRQEIASQAAAEGGKPLKDSLVEVDRGVEGILACAEELRGHAGHVIPMDLNPASAGRLAFTQYEPIGVVVGISAFNHPFNLVVHQLAPAIAVGAPVIIKPATTTPLSCKTLIDIFVEAGLPDRWAQMVLPTDNALATALACDPRVAFLSFIGSAAVGWMLRSNLAPGTRCALEHGGVAPVIVAGDADLGDAIPRIARGAFFHAGQACVSVQRVFCHQSIAEQVAAGLAEHADRMIVGDPLDLATDVGPLISHRELERVQSWVEAAVAQGARLVAGGNRLSDSCYANTVLLNPDANSDVMRKEVFGPVVCVYAFDDIADAIAMANDLPFAFQGAVFTQNLDTAMRCYAEIDGTAIMINEHSLFRHDTMPFAGAKASGLGVGGIPYTMRDMQTEKMMVWRSPALTV